MIYLVFMYCINAKSKNRYRVTGGIWATRSFSCGLRRQTYKNVNVSPRKIALPKKNVYAVLRSTEYLRTMLYTEYILNQLWMDLCYNLLEYLLTCVIYCVWLVQDKFGRSRRGLGTTAKVAWWYTTLLTASLNRRNLPRSS
jgi:hypothetical protein